uniref:Uncharacterized protein n=1 Tax=Parascaris univalens TaxID=6257 RepID=A0A915CBW7_PARUN
PQLCMNHGYRSLIASLQTRKIKITLQRHAAADIVFETAVPVEFGEFIRESNYSTHSRHISRIIFTSFYIT